ncbi:MAG: YabP/YqfC family sporulation protein [bacterium]|nr:YabP/YqfC family sporulation protein [bacterium]
MTEHKKTISSQTHGISVDNRSKMTVTGVADVAGFSEEKVEIQTVMGKLIVKGKKLNVNTLNTDTGELKLTGEIKSMDYSDTRRGGGLFAGLFN